MLTKSANQAPKPNTPSWVPALKIFIRLSAWIMLPLLAGLILGKYLDNRYQSSPKWFLIVTGCAFIISMVGLIKNTLEAYKDIEKQDKDKDSGAKAPD